MAGRTYRYMTEKPLYPFGYGLSYTTFKYGKPEIVSADDHTLTLTVDVTNTGAYDGWEKVQCYARFSDSRTTTPNCQLCAVAPVYLKQGETKTVELTVDRFWLKAVTEDGQRVDPDGGVTLYVGSCQPDGTTEGIGL